MEVGTDKYIQMHTLNCSEKLVLVCLGLSTIFFEPFSMQHFFLLDKTTYNRDEDVNLIIFFDYNQDLPLSKEEKLPIVKVFH